MFSYPTPCNYESRLIKLVFGGPIAVAPCSCIPKKNIPAKFQLPAPYSFHDIDQKIKKIEGQGHYGEIKGQFRSHHVVAQLHPK